MSSDTSSTIVRNWSCTDPWRCCIRELPISEKLTPGVSSPDTTLLIALLIVFEMECFLFPNQKVLRISNPCLTICEVFKRPNFSIHHRFLYTVTKRSTIICKKSLYISEITMFFIADMHACRFKATIVVNNNDGCYATPLWRTLRWPRIPWLT